MSNGLKLILLLAEVVTVFSAVLVAFLPNVLRASIALLFAFMGVAVMFIFAGADFLAGAQVIVYVGGVTILILFAIMLTEWLYQVRLRDVRTKILPVVVVVALGLFPFLWKGMKELSTMTLASPPEKMIEFAGLPKTQLIGKALLGNYLLPFEAITILLLGALVGAVWLARPR